MADLRGGPWPPAPSVAHGRPVRSRAMAAVPRVRPRTAIASMVDTERHPLPPTIPTEGENAPDLQDLHWTTKAALVLLAVFVLALPLAGLLGVVHGHPLGVGFLGLAISTLTASILLGAE